MKIAYTYLAQGHLAALPNIVQLRIKKKIQFYADSKDPLHFAKRLVGHAAYRFRIGEYRVIFMIKVQTLYILMIVKRDKAYQEL